MTNLLPTILMVVLLLPARLDMNNTNMPGRTALSMFRITNVELPAHPRRPDAVTQAVPTLSPYVFESFEISGEGMSNGSSLASELLATAMDRFRPHHYSPSPISV